MQYLLLARHGNTFAPGQKVVWVGARNDLPLVESGIVQANNLAQVLKENLFVPNIIYAADLKRTSEYAQIVAAKLEVANLLLTDSRLREIDYGSWSGLSEQEIKEKFGCDEFDQWQRRGIWPSSFAESPEEITYQTRSFVQDVVVDCPHRKLTLAVTSNGRLRYFLELVPNLLKDSISAAKWKVATGHVCLLAYECTTWRVVCWNESSQALSNNIKALVDRL